MEDSVGVEPNLGKFTACRAQSTQSPLLESADDWKVQFGVVVEGGFGQGGTIPFEVAFVSRAGSRPDGVV